MASRGFAALAHVQEARGLLERLVVETVHRAQGGAAREGPVLLAMKHDGLRPLRVEAGDRRQDEDARVVHVDARVVQAGLEGLVEPARQKALRDLVQVRPLGQAPGLGLQELGEGILQAAGQGDGAARLGVERREARPAPPR